MGDELSFRADLFRGTASFYDRFRLSYPVALIGDLIDFAAAKAARLGVGNIRWITQRAEEVDDDATFALVTIGNGFHRLRRRVVAERAMRWLRDGGYLALLWSGGPQRGAAPWQRALDDCAKEWMRRVGEVDRIPAGIDEAFARKPHVGVLAEAGFSIIGRFEFVEVHEWTVPDLIGFVYSTSFLPRAALGEHVTEFEADLEERLHAAEPSGVFREQVSAAYELACRAPVT